MQSGNHTGEQLPAEQIGPWPVGTKLRYWQWKKNSDYIPVEVLGYTKAGRVRVKWPTNEAGYTHISSVSSKSVSSL